MAVDPAIDIETLDAEVVRVQASVAPPLGRPENPNDRCAGGDREMRRASVAANVDSGMFCQLVETF